jgi:uncharacterized protein (UPF0332 family)
MALADDLLEQAKHLASREPKRPKQASLRRAVSTAYYSLFHLLVAATILNWKQIHQRAHVARAFDHKSMKEASNKTAKKQFHAPNAVAGGHLKVVAQAFVELQHHRHAADYDYAKKWSRTEVRSHIDTAAAAFESWKIIHGERLAQDYLVSLLIKERKD